MREILFRGKRICNNEMVFGSLFRCNGGDCYIVTEDFRFRHNHYKVDPSTVGQYTGVTDKNGKRIFEGDVLKDDWGKTYEVIFTTHSCGFMVDCRVAPNKYETGRYRLGDAWCNTIQVIGNIHDNPELLGGDGDV